jgi:hypothetical protein
LSCCPTNRRAAPPTRTYFASCEAGYDECIGLVCLVKGTVAEKKSFFLTLW